MTRPVSHPEGCWQMHKMCGPDDEWCIKCNQRYSPPPGFLDEQGNYTCYQCRHGGAKP